MSVTEIDPDDRRRVISALKDRGPMGHEELAEELGYSWDTTQKIIRDLRSEGRVKIRLDRRYEADETSTSVTA